MPLSMSSHRIGVAYVHANNPDESANGALREEKTMPPNSVIRSGTGKADRIKWEGAGAEISTPAEGHLAKAEG